MDEPDFTGLTLDQFWRCPVCGTSIAAGHADLKPPRCSHGEMEQVTAEGFNAGFHPREETDHG